MIKKSLFKFNGKWELPEFDIYNFSKKQNEYCICIPILNEDEKIKKQLKRLLPYSKIVDIIICDGNSTDGSTKRNFLKRCHVRTLLIKRSAGGQAAQLRMGFAYALKMGYEGIIQIDGNNKDGVDAIPKFLQALEQGYDYVQGSRFIKRGKAINTPLARWVGVRLIASPVLTLAAGYLYTDVTNGFRGYSRKYLTHPKVQLFRNIFVRYELNMYLTARAKRLGLRTKEIPVTRKYPKGKTPTKISFIRGNWDFLVTIFKVALGFYNPK